MENGDQPQNVEDTKESLESKEPKELKKSKVRKSWEKIHLREWIEDLYDGLWSSDPWTRLITGVFFLSAGGGLILLSAIAIHGWRVRKDVALEQSVLIAQHAKELEEKETETERKRARIINLGVFLIELKPLTKEELNTKIPPPNMAELEIVLVCDSLETRNYINDHVVQVRNQIINMFTPVSRGDMLATEAKRHLRETLKRKLNGWLPKGEIRELYFPKLIVS